MNSFSAITLSFCNLFISHGCIWTEFGDLTEISNLFPNTASVVFFSFGNEQLSNLFPYEPKLKPKCCGMSLKFSYEIHMDKNNADSLYGILLKYLLTGLRQINKECSLY